MANITPYGLRMQPQLKSDVEDAARANNRSLNAEIVHRLEEYDYLQKESRRLSDLILEAERELKRLRISQEIMEAERNDARREIEVLHAEYANVLKQNDELKTKITPMEMVLERLARIESFLSEKGLGD